MRLLRLGRMLRLLLLPVCALRNAHRDRTLERQFPLLRLSALIRAHNALYQRMADHVAFFKVAKGHALDAAQYIDRVEQARLGAGWADRSA